MKINGPSLLWHPFKRLRWAWKEANDPKNWPICKKCEGTGLAVPSKSPGL